MWFETAKFQLQVFRLDGVPRRIEPNSFSALTRSGVKVHPLGLQASFRSYAKSDVVSRKLADTANSAKFIFNDSHQRVKILADPEPRRCALQSIGGSLQDRGVEPPLVVVPPPVAPY
jgi:hypothetical protein